MRLKESQRMLKYHKMQAPQGMFHLIRPRRECEAR